MSLIEHRKVHLSFVSKGPQPALAANPAQYNSHRQAQTQVLCASGREVIAGISAQPKLAREIPDLNSAPH